ncbi:alpha/beta fold hydrolase [Amycolatopsis panacis]|uniref:Alpha/beta fold hydrolase n=1 Tax=Amycolatopsis panacis TaxID=2340917 RepID=A0A419HJE2_9PSEU|nr:alpha/beta fold hydrolase [Amycolatopsis panacis]RJQ75899.1 alpha/beta fold hydrolase [Amycolatopsis panacis]
MPYFVVRPEVELFATDEGTGPAVLLLHGWAGDGTDWSPLAADLIADHRVVVPDHRGHGRSSVPDGPYDAKTLAADAATLLRACDVPSAVVIGHSLGGAVASALAVEEPDLVDALVLVEPAQGRHDDLLKPALEAMRADPHSAAAQVFATFPAPDSPPWLEVWRRRRLAGTPLRVIADVYEQLFAGPEALGREAVGRSYLSRRRCPILSIYGGASPTFAAWDRALPHGPHDEVVEWPTAGHFPQHDDPAGFSALVRRWLSGLGFG